MRLDRNLPVPGHQHRGKYALVKMRLMGAVLDTTPPLALAESRIEAAYALLCDTGFIHHGDEDEGAQFFVMKYSDEFAKAGLEGYASAIRKKIIALGGTEPMTSSLLEYLKDIEHEISLAAAAPKKEIS